MRAFRVVLVVCGLLLVGYVVYRFAVPTDAQRIARVVERVRQGIVRRDLILAMSSFDRSYEDDYGHDYGRLSNWFERLFQPYDSIDCSFTRLGVMVEGEEASCALTFRAAGYTKANRGLEIADASPLYSERVVLYLYKYDTGWRIVSASP